MSAKFFTRLQAYCMAFPGAVEEYPWEHTVWKVGGKMFVIGDEHADRITLKATPEQQAVLIQDPAITPSPYLAKSGWVTVEIGDESAFSMAQDLIDESYRLVVEKLPKKLQRELGAIE